MKSYTDLEQSKKLAKILPTESADMVYIDAGYCSRVLPSNDIDANSYPTICPCWSLTALLDILPNQFNECTKTLYWFNNTWYCAYVDEDFEYEVSMSGNNPVDACFKMVFELKRLIDNNLL